MSIEPHPGEIGMGTSREIHRLVQILQSITRSTKEELEAGKTLEVLVSLDSILLVGVMLDEAFGHFLKKNRLA